MTFLEVVLKPSIGLKVKADRDVQQEQHIKYFEDRTALPNTEFEA